MISYIKGKPDHISENSITLENNGIGYEIIASPLTISKISNKRDQEIKLYTYLNVKEDGISLYGFLTQEEINLFLMLISVSGIGPKIAVGALAAMTPVQLMVAILSDDIAALSKAPGIGKKTAQRLSLELKDKLKGKELPEVASGNPTLATTGGDKQDAIDALVALGYARADAVKAVMETAVDRMTAEQIIKAALRRLTQ